MVDVATVYGETHIDVSISMMEWTFVIRNAPQPDVIAIPDRCPARLVVRVNFPGFIAAGSLAHVRRVGARAGLGVRAAGSDHAEPIVSALLPTVVDAHSSAGSDDPVVDRIDRINFEHL